MILRYFYIDKYNEIAQNLDINLGGKYKFQYQDTKNQLLFIKNETYVENLYEEYNVISDVSAILGKNSAGKTTILRMINTIFNSFESYDKAKYIIIFEKGGTYILYTNYMDIEYDPKTLDKEIQHLEIKSFNAIDILKEVGLIYFSNVFDRATPFQGNANLIDISANYMFEQFNIDYINGKMKNIGEGINILEEYKSESILAEIDFLLDINRLTFTEKPNLLFDIPAQIKLGFSQILPDFGNDPLYDQDEYNHLLKEIYMSLEKYLGENQDFDGEKVSYFQREIVFYFLFDELCRFYREDKYNVLDALKYWIKKIEIQDWEISSYYQEILGMLGIEHAIEDTTDIDITDDLESEDEDYDEEALYSIWEEFDRIHHQLKIDCLEKVDYGLIIYKLSKIRIMAEIEQWKNYHIVSYNLNMAEYLLERVQYDLIDHDYDLFNTTCICEADFYIEEAVKAYNGEIFTYAFWDDDLNNGQIAPIDVDEIPEIKPILDKDTENHLDILQKVINTLIYFTNNYEYDADNNMLNVSLDCEDILEFIYNFQELDCKTVVLDIKRTDISSGHSAYLNMCARINSARKSGEIRRKENVILLIDEGDLYLHPEKQLAYMDNLLKLLQILYQGKKIQLIITSNSPFIISDIQSSNILYIEKKKKKIEIVKSDILNTFASNVNVLLLDSFFVENGLIGEYARKKIDSILQDLRDSNLPESKYLQLENLIKIIGEPVIRRKLETLLFHSPSFDNNEREIQYYKKMLNQMMRKDK